MELGHRKYSFVCVSMDTKLVLMMYAIVARDEFDEHEYSKHAHIHGVTAEG